MQGRRVCVCGRALVLTGMPCHAVPHLPERPVSALSKMSTRRILDSSSSTCGPWQIGWMECQASREANSGRRGSAGQGRAGEGMNERMPSHALAEVAGGQGGGSPWPAALRCMGDAQPRPPAPSRLTVIGQPYWVVPCKAAEDNTPCAVTGNAWPALSQRAARQHRSTGGGPPAKAPLRLSRAPPSSLPPPPHQALDHHKGRLAAVRAKQVVAVVDVACGRGGSGVVLDPTESIVARWRQSIACPAARASRCAAGGPAGALTNLLGPGGAEEGHVLGRRGRHRVALGRQLKGVHPAGQREEQEEGGGGRRRAAGGGGHG